MLRKLGLVALLIASTIVLSGCWGRVAGPTGGHQVLVIKPKVSDLIIADSTQRCGEGQSRGVCALATIRGLCENVRLSDTNPINRFHCVSITWEDHRYDIEDAIRQVVTPGYDCLGADIANPNPPWFDWFALPRGAYGCKD